MMVARRFSEAAEYFRRWPGNSASVPSSPDGAAQQAIELLLAIAESRPQWSTGQFSLGCAYEHLGDFERARAHLENALLLDPCHKAGVETLKARMFFVEGRFSEALDAADRALAVNPRSHVALAVRGRACCNLFRGADGVPSLRRALEVLPDQPSHSSLLFQMSYLAETTPEALYAEASRWNALYAAPLASQILPHTNSPDPERRVKIGYVSPDLYQHPVMKLAPALFDLHNRSQFEVFVYAVGTESDHISQAVRGMVDHYAAIRGSYSELAAHVRQDGVDILIDLAGHTMGPELLAFALKPAPVQVTWLGYPATTGMTAMDYFLGDQHIPCRGTQNCFSEKVYRLPRVLACYRPIGDVPIGPPPCLERGYVTFGCFNSPRKITREVIKLWSAILHLAPHSKLLLKYHHVDVWPSGLRSCFEEDGIAAERILIEGPSPPGEYLTAYNRIDIALDPFPYNGGTTTLDALWMGMPVVTLAGRLAVQCVGASILSGAGLPEFVTRTPEQYLKAALYLAAAVPKRPELRGDIRKALMASPWMDEAGIVREIENAYRDMWRKWCTRAGSPSGI